MKTVKFVATDNGYTCSLPGDQSGEYVRVEDVIDWISVKDGLPGDPLEKCFVTTIEGYDNKRHFYIAWPPDGDDGWLLVGPMVSMDKDCEIKNVTHYIPLSLMLPSLTPLTD